LSGDHGGGGVMLDDLYGDASITNTVINGDNTAPAGGGVYVEDLFGNMTLTGSTVSGNEATGYSGGGLYLDFVTGNVTISTTTIADNSAAETGGGVSVETGDRGGGAVSVSNSTISGNDAGSAGGGWFEAYTGGQTSFFNSTVSGNTAADSGGGIWFYGYHGLALVQTTIADNTAPDGAGVFIPTPYQSGGGAVAAHARTKTTAAQVNSKAATKGKGARAEKVHTRAAPVHAAALDEVSATGTIIAGNHGSDVAESGSLSASHSLIGTIVGTTLVDQGGNKLGVDPMLGALANNGGPTMTMELLVGSPAINAGPDPVPAFAGNEFDQRGAGYPRVSGGTVDIGAFEVQPVAVEIVPKFTG
jgi:hypothetical protein